jgi:hypothetical protein
MSLIAGRAMASQSDSDMMWNDRISFADGVKKSILLFITADKPFLFMNANLRKVWKPCYCKQQS